MASWNDLLRELDALPSEDRQVEWLERKLTSALNNVGALRKESNVILYMTAFLQKPQAPAHLLQITAEDVNGLMSVIYGMDFAKPLTLILHTPGGVPNAAETIVAYLRQKFPGIESGVPALAMSAGTMVALASDTIVMGRPSQLGPIDPQMPMPATGRFASARAIVDQFDEAKKEILGNQVTAHAWAPILQSLGPALLQEARNALDYGETMVRKWLEAYMFAGHPDAPTKANAAAQHFNDAARHKSHGRRIDREEVRALGIRVEDLEDSQNLQESVLTAYHLGTIVFERGMAAKLMVGSNGRTWTKNWTDPRFVAPAVTPPSPSAPTQQPPMSRQQRRQQQRKNQK